MSWMDPELSNVSKIPLKHIVKQKPTIVPGSRSSLDQERATPYATSRDATAHRSDSRETDAPSRDRLPDKSFTLAAELWLPAEADVDGLTASYQIFQASKPQPQPPQADANTNTTWTLRRELHDLLSSGSAGYCHPPLTVDQTPRRLARPAPPLFLGPRRRLLPPPFPQKVSSRHRRATSPSTYRGAAVMSVAFEPRPFANEGAAYPPIGDEHDHGADQRYTDVEMAEHLSHYTADASLLGDDRGLMGGDDVTSVVQDAARLELAAAAFSSPIPISVHAPSIPTEAVRESKDPSPSAGSPPQPRTKAIPKPDRDVSKQADGKFHCPLEECKEEVRAFARKCEWKYVV